MNVIPPKPYNPVHEVEAGDIVFLPEGAYYIVVDMMDGAETHGLVSLGGRMGVRYYQKSLKDLRDILSGMGAVVYLKQEYQLQLVESDEESF